MTTYIYTYIYAYIYIYIYIYIAIVPIVHIVHMPIVAAFVLRGNIILNKVFSQLPLLTCLKIKGSIVP